MINNDLLFMAFGAGASTDTAAFKRYIGVASLWIKGVNPTKEEAEEFFGFKQSKDPVYVDTVEIDGQKYDRVKLDLLVETDPEFNNGIETKQRVSYYITNKEVTSRDGKLQIIDRYGRSAWATVDEVKAHATLLTDKNGNKYQANIDENYWVARRGEVDLAALMKAYRRIPNVEKWEDNRVVGLIDNPAAAEVYFEHLDDMLKGDISEFVNGYKEYPNNKFKLGFGIQTADDNKLYQAFFTSFPMKNGVTDYSRFARQVAEAQNAGMYPNVEFRACPLEEYVVRPSEIPSPTPTAAPVNWFKKD